MTKPIQQIRIFISSPSDVETEKESALKVISELNITLCESHSISLCPLTWENNTFPSVGRDSQDIINKQIGEYDIYIGIMANRFGTKTNRAGSGTEEEFNIAYNNRRNTHIMFFFKDAPISPSRADLDQLKKVLKFKKKLPNKGVLYREFTENFEKVFRVCLTLCINQNYLQKNVKVSNDNLKIIDRHKTEIEEFIFSNNPTYKKYRIINALAKPNSQFNLKDIYIAQTLIKEERSSNFKDYETIKIDNLPVSLIKYYKKILIKDTAGMGKSTIMKYMFIDLIDNCKKDVGIPIFIELNRLNKNRTILQEIQKELPHLDNDSLLIILQAGGFIFFLDGYDEILISDSNEVTHDIKTFISKTEDNNYFILASRPEDSLASFGDFLSFKIQPLSKIEAFELLEKYDTSEDKKISKELIKELKSGKYDTAIDEYLENPLLVSLLHIAFNYKSEIPLKKHQYYRQVFDALYSAHKLAQDQKPHEKRSGLDIDDFDRILRYVGYECIIKIGVQFDKDSILDSIERAKIYFDNLKFGKSAFLNDLLTSVPLFSRDGTEYKWVHKSLMEYFAARFIAVDSQNKDEILTAIYNSQHFTNYINMLDIYFDIDAKGFSKNIVLPFCVGYLNFFNNNYIEIKNINKKLIEERIALLFINDFAFVNSHIRNSWKDVYRIINLGLSAPQTIRFPDFERTQRIMNVSIKKNKKNHQLLQVLPLLVKKTPSLFTQGRRIISPNAFNKIDSNFQRNEICIVNVTTGEKSEDLYIAVNEILYAEILTRGINIPILDYTSCKIETDKINSRINHNDIDLLSNIE